MEMYDGYEVLNRRIQAEKDGTPLIYKCPSCNSDIDLNYNLSPTTFRDNLSYREFLISGLCQKCQDKVFGI